jgi:hypothetical protein
MNNAAIEAAFEATRRRIETPGWAADGALPAIGTELDGLADDVPLHEWSEARRIVFEALRGIKLSKRWPY